MTKQIKRIQFDPPGNIEIFYTEDGSTEWQKLISSADYQEFLVERQLEINNGIQSTPKPNWSSFTISMFANSNYQLIRKTTTNQVQAQQLEISVVAIASGAIVLIPEVFFGLWNTVVKGIEIPPTSEAVQEWVAIAQSANMPFTFSTSGMMIALT